MRTEDTGNINMMSNTSPINNKTDSKKADVPKDNSNKGRPDTFEEFSGYTTLHGVRFIGDHDSFIPRRLIWLCIVLLSASLFTFQVVDRIQYYLKSPITVNLKVNYNKSLAFPAVTICNQNLFKLSAAKRDDMIGVIETIYGYNAANEFHMKYNLTLDVLHTQYAHKKEDLIVKCRWGKQECYPENFTTTYTSHGMCYTFNNVDSPDDAHTVNASGVDYGLKLTLNTENFERMAGPHTTAGIKLIATDHSEMPNVEEVGISISAGIHAYVGLKLLSINNLEPPYGQCGERDLLTTDRYTPDSCYLECETFYLKEHCDCRHYYMPNIDGKTRVCNMPDLLSCVSYNLELFKDQKDELCDCPTSCIYNIYESTISYAKKSEWGAEFEKEVGTYTANDINNKYETAMEINSKMDTNAILELNDIIKRALRSIELLNNSMDQSHTSVSALNDTLQEYHNDTVDAIKTRSALYDVQTYIIKNNFKRGYDAVEERTFGVLCHGYREFLHKIRYLLNNNESSDSKNTQNLIEEMIYNKLNISNETFSAYLHIIQSYQKGVPIYEYSNNVHNDFNETVLNAAIPKQLLQEAINGEVAYQNIILIKEDIGNIDKVLSNILSTSNSIFNNKKHNSNMKEINSLIHELSERCQNFLDTKSQLYSEIVEKPLLIIKQRKETLAALQENYNMAYEIIINQMMDVHGQIEDVILSRIPPFKEKLTFASIQNGFDYKGNVTKYDVALEISQYDMPSKVKQLEERMTVTKSRLDELSKSLSIVSARLDSIWKYLLESHDDNEQYDELINDFVLYNNYSDIMHEELDYDQYYIKSMIKDIGWSITEAVEKINMLISKMSDYVKRHKTGDDFYKENLLEVDVYFKELRSEQIDQQKAYDEFALLCDIGGSMGLFIGGSAITFFEVVDFLILCFVHKVFKRWI